MDIKLVVIQVQSKHMLPPPNCSFVGKPSTSFYITIPNQNGNIDTTVGEWLSN
jgi:hypothetical protein